MKNTKQYQSAIGSSKHLPFSSRLHIGGPHVSCPMFCNFLIPEVVLVEQISMIRANKAKKNDGNNQKKGQNNQGPHKMFYPIITIISQVNNRLNQTSKQVCTIAEPS